MKTEEPITFITDSKADWNPCDIEILHAMLDLKIIPAIREQLKRSCCGLCGPIQIGDFLIYTITPPDGRRPLHFTIQVEAKSFSEMYISLTFDGENADGDGHVTTTPITKRWPVTWKVIQQSFCRLYDAMTKVADIPTIDWPLLKV